MTIEELLAKIATEAVTPEELQQTIDALVKTSVEEASAGLKAKNTQLLAVNTKLKTAAAVIPDGFDPEQYQTMLDEHKANKDAKLVAEERWDELKTGLVTKHTEQMQAKDATIAGLRTALQGQLIDSTLTTELVAQKGNSALLLPHVKHFVSMVEDDDGTYSTAVIDATGVPRYSMEKPGEPMPVAELIAEFKANPVYRVAFEAENSGGGAHTTNSSGNGVVNPFQRGANFNRTAQAILHKENPVLASKMREQAKAAQ